MQETGEGQQGYDLFYAQFNPKHRVLVSAGNHFVASMWDLRADSHTKFGPPSSLPHVSGQEQSSRNTADVSSVHWS